MSETRTIEATGRGVVRAKPDVAVLELAVVTEAKKPADAIEENAARMNQVIEAVRAQKIPESAIQTSTLRLQPLYKWNEDAQNHFLVGYLATNAITVRAPIDAAGPVYDAGVTAGANGAGGILFTVTDDRKYRREALSLATKHAVEEIHAVAKTLGAHLSGPMQAQVLFDSQPQPYQLALEKAAASDTPVMPGRVEISARVRVVYTIKP
jgi:uncharacterized protein YggE